MSTATPLDRIGKSESFELLVLELEYRPQSGEKKELEEYRRRFPQHAELIDAAISR
jgi:hypothetical protein